MPSQGMTGSQVGRQGGQRCVVAPSPYSDPPSSPIGLSIRPGCSPRRALQPSPRLSLLPARSSAHSSHHTAFAHAVPTYWNICSSLSHLRGLCSPFSSQLSFVQEAFLTSPTMSTLLPHYGNHLGLLGHKWTFLRVIRSASVPYTKLLVGRDHCLPRGWHRVGASLIFVG